jgi:hypothetical protein
MMLLRTMPWPPAGVCLKSSGLSAAAYTRSLSVIVVRKGSWPFEQDLQEPGRSCELRSVGQRSGRNTIVGRPECQRPGILSEALDRKRIYGLGPTFFGRGQD